MDRIHRLSRLRALLSERALDAVVITHPSNRFWLSGYTGEDIAPNESAGHVVITHQEAYLVVSTMNAPQARQEAPHFQIYDRERNFARADALLLQECGARRIGFEDGAILYQDYQTLSQTLGEGVSLEPLGPAVDALREVKTSDELERIIRAQQITEQALLTALAEFTPGQTERTLARRLDQAMLEHGADRPAFPTIVASGPNAALPHHTPGDRSIAPGETVVIDMGAMVDGYCADLTRTVWFGELPSEAEYAFTVVLQALEAVERQLHAGMTGKAADGIAREHIAAAGYGEAFTHSLGHGVGVRVHEGPALSPRNEEPLPAGSVVTLEPGIYRPGQFGIRIEDLVVIEPDGLRILTTVPKRITLPLA